MSMADSYICFCQTQIQNHSQYSIIGSYPQTSCGGTKIPNGFSSLPYRLTNHHALEKPKYEMILSPDAINGKFHTKHCFMHKTI